MRYDAVVIGGGPAGSTAALLLARAGWTVALVEQAVFPRRKVCGEFLSATNIPLLQELGVWDEFLEAAGPPVTRVGIFAGAVKA
jgi:2-polyprenyl-6-methoxyphenol hydroxylase-like FAD-dependent oxidoreductase